MDETTCWICFSPHGELSNLCKCPNVVHKKCLARWQLECAGRQEERKCRFCSQEFPDWKPSLTPVNLTPVNPNISVYYGNNVYTIKLDLSKGRDDFINKLIDITGIPNLMDVMDISFECREPETNDELKLKGLSSFDAAMFCASISAAKKTEAIARTPVRTPEQTKVTALTLFTKLWRKTCRLIREKTRF
jgi:hypothetical protein